MKYVRNFSLKLELLQIAHGLNHLMFLLTGSPTTHFHRQNRALKWHLIGYTTLECLSVNI